MAPSPAPLRVTHAAGAYGVTVEPLGALPARLAGVGFQPGLALVVTDTTVARLHLDALVGPLRQAGWTPVALDVPPGEGSKSPETLALVYDWALGLGVTRGTPVLALGGGVVGDLAGFAAATLLRGLPLVQLPSTTIAQVDSAIGGKTGINHAAGKNLVGAFWAPELVLADPALLQTLRERDYLSGLAEAVKHALLDGPDAVERLDAHWTPLVARDAGTVAAVVRDAAALKCAVVSADEREGGQRAFLNLGHTFGHAVERAAGYGTFTHGEAVAFGLRAALHLSASLAFGPVEAGAPLAQAGDGRFGAAERLVRRLPTPALPGDASNGRLVEAMATDKKRDASGVRFVALDAPGAPRLATDVPTALVEAALDHARATTGAPTA